MRLQRLLAELPGSIQSSSSSADQELQAAKTKIVSLERVAKEAKLLYEQEKNKAQEQEQMIKLVQQAVQRQEEVSARSRIRGVEVCSHFRSTSLRAEVSVAVSRISHHNATIFPTCAFRFRTPTRKFRSPNKLFKFKHNLLQLVTRVTCANIRIVSSSCGWTSVRSCKP